MQALDIERSRPGSDDAASTPRQQRAVSAARYGDVAVLTLVTDRHGGLSATVGAEMVQALAAAASERDATAIVVVIAGSGGLFAAEADRVEVDRNTSRHPLRELVEAIETCPLPVVAAWCTHAVGDGVELALGCDARVCSDDAALRMPQVTLGVLPRAGGTQLLPRVVGRAAATDIICSGRTVPADEAVSRGLVDAVSADDLLERAVACARQLAPFKRRLRDRPVAADDEAFEYAAAAARHSGRGRPSVDAALAAIRASATQPLDAALALERQLFETLDASHDAHAVRYHQRALRQVAVVPMADALAQAVKTIGIVGAGKLGQRLAEAFAGAGVSVTLVDRNRRAAAAAAKRLKRSNVDLAGSLVAVSGCDFVIEAVVEDYDTKAAIFIALDELLPVDRVIASTTSGVDIDALAAVTRRSKRICGMHLVPNADSAAAVEVVRCIDTSPQTLAVAVGLSRRIGLLPVVVGNAYGYIGRRMKGAVQNVCTLMCREGMVPERVNEAMRHFGFSDWFISRVVPIPAPAPPGRRRDDGVIDRIMLALVNEAACLLEDGVASAASDIDALLTQAYGFPVWEGGPAYWASQRSLRSMVADRDTALAGTAHLRRGRLELLQMRAAP